ncbi:MAG: hypothetical protein RL250_1450 [Verrucomicrobiota bacterium]|jgi:hypothetical protein
MPPLLRCALIFALCIGLPAAESPPAQPSSTSESLANQPWRYESRLIRGWSVLIRLELLTEDKKAETEKGLLLITQQLEDIERLVPPKALAQLRRVTLWLSPPYANARPRAEYHPGADWLKANGRNPAMAKGVEFTDVSHLDKEVLRMPLLTLHELAHAYHDQVLGFGHPGIKACYEQAVANHSYDKVSRKNWEGKITEGVRAYAMTNPMEYFSETTEAFFGRNDFFPYERKELEAHDPAMVAVLKKVWGAP